MLLKAMEANFKLHSDTQMETFTALLEQHRAATDERFGQFVSASQQPLSGSTATGSHPPPVGDQHSAGGRRPVGESSPKELESLLKTLRVKVPRFDGSNVETWIYKISKFFDLHRVDLELRLAVVAFHLEGGPATWYQWMERGGLLPSWSVFLLELRKRYGTSVYDDPLGRIAKLTQTWTVDQYRAAFEELMTQISGVPDALFLNFFVWGLKLSIRRELLLMAPTDLADAMAKAQLFEDRHEELAGRFRPEPLPFGSMGRRLAGVESLGTLKPIPPSTTSP